RANQQNAARRHEACQRLQEIWKVGNVLYDSKGQYRVECARLICTVLRQSMPVADRGTAQPRMSLGYHYVALGGIDAKHIGSQSRERFRYETRAAADINHVQTGQGPCCARVPLKQHGQALRNVPHSHPIEGVDHFEGAVWVPPFFGQRVEAGDLGRVGCPDRGGGALLFVLSQHERRPVVPGANGGAQPLKPVAAPPTTWWRRPLRLTHGPCAA